MRKPQKLVINWRAIPFIRLTFPFILGIYLAEYLNVHHYLMDIFLFALLISLFFSKNRLSHFTKRWIPGAIIYCFFFLLGYLLTYGYQDTKQPNHFQQAIKVENHLIGIVQNMPKTKNGKIKIELETQLIGSSHKSLIPCGGRILLYLNNYEGASSVKYGDQILVKSKIIRPKKAKNPQVFDYKQYLHFQNIHFQSFVNKENWTILKNNQGNVIFQTAFQLRRHFLKVLQKNIHSQKELAVASALILGYKDDLSKELKSAYAETGAIHVLAVSGLHVGIVSGLLMLFLNFFQAKNWCWKWIKLGLILLAIWGFALITGMSPSVQRAAIMFSALHFGRTLDREINIYNSLAIAAFLILISNPYSLFNVGFQFSFIAVIGIVFFTPKITKFWIPKHWLIYRIWQMTVVGISAQIAVFPLILYYFHQVPTYFWLTGLFVIPFASAILYGGIGLLISSFFSATTASLLGWFISIIIFIQNTLITFIQALPLHFLNGIWISQIEVLLFYGFVLGLGLMLLTKRLRWIRLSLISLVLVSCVQIEKSYEQINQKKIIIYSISKNSLIDFVDGKDIYSLSSGELSQNTFDYTIQNNRWSLGTENIININNEQTQKDNFYKKKNYLQFYDKKIVIVNQKLPKKREALKPFDCDYLILQNNPPVDLKKLIAHYHFNEIIFDGSNSNWRVTQWKAICQELGLKFKDVKNENSYTIEL